MALRLLNRHGLRRLSAFFWAVFVMPAVGERAEPQNTATVWMNPLPNPAPLTQIYNQKVVKLALEKSRPHDGAFDLEFIERPLSLHRILLELGKPDGRINTHVTLASREREEEFIAIEIPIRFGLLSYRLLMVHKDQLDLFAKVYSTEELLKLRPGLVFDWVTTAAYQEKNVKYVKAMSTESLFRMLEAKRFDYLSRGVSEIFDDLNLYTQDLPDLVIEPNLALYLPAPYYIYVSKSKPALAQRLQSGLEIAIADGSLKTLFLKFYADAIASAKLDKRRVIFLDNPAISRSLPYKRKELWYFHSPRFAASVFEYAVSTSASSPSGLQ